MLFNVLQAAMPSQAMNGLLANGQIPTRVRLNLAQPVQRLIPSPANDAQELTIHTNFVNGQMNVGSRLVAQQLIGLNQQQQQQQQQLQQIPQIISHTQNQDQHPEEDPSGLHHPFEAISPSKIQFVDHTETHILFKRQAEKKNVSGESSRSNSKRLQKRELVLMGDGRVVEDDPLLIGSIEFKYDGLAEFGGSQFKSDLDGRMQNIDEEVQEHDKEAAEEEVKAVMGLCGSCQLEPFQGAIVFAWKTVQEQMDNVLKGYSVGGCGDF